MIPKTLKNFNLVIAGLSMAGLVEEITLPKLVRKMEEHQAGGMLGPVSLDFGMEALEMEFSLKEYSTDVLKSFGVASPSGINARFMGALVAEGTDAIEISVRGRWQELDAGTAKMGESSPLKVKMPLTYYKYSQNGDAIIEIDLEHNICVVNGEDLMADIRTAIGQ